jgi:hypothetical protein
MEWQKANQIGQTAKPQPTAFRKEEGNGLEEFLAKWNWK